MEYCIVILAFFCFCLHSSGSCYAANEVYVVPVTYVFHEGYIYALSKEGRKIKMMCKNPITSESVRPPQGKAHPPEIIEKGFKALAYRIKVTKSTGRYKKTSAYDLE